MDTLKGITWQGVAALAIVAGTVLGLVKMGQPLAAIGSAFGAAIWYVTSQQNAARKADEVRNERTEAQLGTIEKQVNGTNEALRTENARLHKVIAVLAAQLPPGAPLPKTLTDETSEKA